MSPLPSTSSETGDEKENGKERDSDSHSPRLSPIPHVPHCQRRHERNENAVADRVSPPSNHSKEQADADDQEQDGPKLGVSYKKDTCHQRHDKESGYVEKPSNLADGRPHNQQ
jgi:hypothetical protein